ncbi:PSD1 and planctomycete cytochrome C domain-containing protein [Candidatus Laterigemmans baculatus]|uniref:PSD1 and planctomycete cytochrome C domain-containing protein n=1 Tax=Candidatus Laterigemmans baculatus TaxID=2770505 RepID=UPI0013DC798B|nr:PSD1 and planctomycete cytochrome C domain-containing protein [Candidatus Laterigemmans baculatus]
MTPAPAWFLASVRLTPALRPSLLLIAAVLSAAGTLPIGAGLAGAGRGEASAAEPDSAKTPAATSPEGVEFFEKKIRPLLATHCYDCHSESAQEGDLRVDTWEGMAVGGGSGPSIQPGKANSSLLLVAVRYQDPSLQMPPDGKLSDAEIADLEKWLAIGAPHPDADGAVPLPVAASKAEDLWSLKPIARPTPPQVENPQWVANPIDAFILTRLEAAGVAPNEPADRRTLIRRVTFDLTGLPPTPEEVERFMADEDPRAYENLVDRLLASPAYGERWGRHWLDVARYADSNGLDENIAHGNAWRYRDWVVGAWNEDLPYDQFVHQQLAGDLLPSDDRETRYDHLTATGYLSLGPKVLAEADKMKMEMDIIDEQLDTLGRSFLGLTFGCARCHDHKFDPILTKDYYALAGVFKSTHTMDSFKTIARWHEHETATPEQLVAQKQHTEQVAEKKQAVEQLIAQANDQLRNQLGQAAAFPDKPEEHYPEETKKELEALRKTVADLEKTPPAVDSVMGVSEGEVTDLAVHIRGSHLSLGEVAPRQFPEWLPTAQEFEIPDDQSGRLQVAQWITDPENPLSWRVIVNRVWRWHFGRGLVASVDNFGNLGDQPTHPELLDWLARDFAEGGASIKRLHRLILLSSTYRLSAAANEAGQRVDPANELLWRSPLRRLEAEAIRDSLLAVGGMLDRRMGGSRLHVDNRAFLFDHTSKDLTSYDFQIRSLYLPVIRNNLYDGFELFDYGDGAVINGDRSTTTVPTQALFVMNSPLMKDASEGLARRILAESEVASHSEAGPRSASGLAGDPVAAMYRLAVGREPSEAEREQVWRAHAQLETLFATTPPPEPPVTAAVDAAAAEEKPAEEKTAEEKSAAEKPAAESAASAAAEPEPPVSAEFRAWAAICHALLASNEFIYLQ